LLGFLRQVGLLLTHTTFEPFDRFSKMRYHWIPWIKTNSTFNGDNFRLYRFSVIPGFIKKPLKAYFSYNFGQIFFKITRDDLQTKPHRKLTTVCPVQPLKFSRKAAKQEVKLYQSKSLRYKPGQQWK